MKMEHVLKNKQISMEAKYRIIKSYVWSVLNYACETWTITPKLEKRLESTELWFWRRMMGIIWRDHVTNEEVWRRCKRKPELMSMIIKRQMGFIGRVMRGEGLENLILTGYIEGRKRGRKRYKFTDNLKRWTKIDDITAILHTTRNSCSWRAMTWASGHGTQ